MKHLTILALVLIGVALSLAASSNKPPTGTLELLNAPVYGGEAVFHVVLERHASLPTSAIWCSQDGTYARMNEQRLPNFGSRLDIVFSRSLSNPIFNGLAPMDCSAAVFQDTRNGSQQPTALTNWVEFSVEGGTP